MVIERRPKKLKLQTFREKFSPCNNLFVVYQIQFVETLHETIFSELSTHLRQSVDKNSEKMVPVSSYFVVPVYGQNGIYFYHYPVQAVPEQLSQFNHNYYYDPSSGTSYNYPAFSSQGHLAILPSPASASVSPGPSSLVSSYNGSIDSTYSFDNSYPRQHHWEQTTKKQQPKPKPAKTAQILSERSGNDQQDEKLLNSLNELSSQLRTCISSIDNVGVKTTETISRGTYIIEYTGERFPTSETNSREALYEQKMYRDYIFKIDNTVSIDATVSTQATIARFINHSCNPNSRCVTHVINGEKRIFIVAKRKIDADEEITFDYRFPVAKKFEKRIPCNCGTRNCRRFLN